VVAKSAAEEAKHRKDYLEMLRRHRIRIERETKLRAKREKEKLARDELVHRLRGQWSAVDLQQIGVCGSEHRDTAVQLVWHGVPPNWRGRVWCAAIGNRCEIDGSVYVDYVERAQRIRRLASQSAVADASSSSSSSNDGAATLENERLMANQLSSSVDLIPIDVPRTFPELKFFQQDGPCFDELRVLLEAFVCYHFERVEIGYVQGMSMVAAMLMINMDARDAFTCLANTLSAPFFLMCYRMEADGLRRCFDCLDDMLATRHARLSAHLRSQGVATDTYAIDWFLTLFAKSLPLDAAARIFDLYCIESAPLLFRAALAILVTLAPRLLAGDFEVCVKLLTKLPRNWCQHELVDAIAQIHLTDDEHERICKL
jgi:Rab-GTPase-TBC domain